MKYHSLLSCVFIIILSFKSSLTARRSRLLTVNQLTTFFSGIHQFSAEFSEILAKEEKGNLICSPISALITLAILDYGADGRTRQELETALNLPMNETYVKLLFHYFMRDLNDATNVELHLANALFLNNEFRINKMFRQISTIIFQPKIENLDFQNTLQSAGKINSWCKENTGGKISEIVEAGDLTEAQLVMVNAIYFKGQWKHRFTHHRKINFEISNTDNVPIEMMCNNAKYNNNQILNGAAYYIELPYETDQPETEFSMYVILPLKSNELDDIIDQVFKIKFVKLNSKESDIDFCMPKFRIESNLELIPVLKKMGISNMFGNGADFSRMSDDNVKISKIIQKAFISVDENGSEAAAATGAQIVTLMMPSTIYVDKPFISVIVSKATGTPLFWARVNDPRSQ